MTVYLLHLLFGVTSLLTLALFGTLLLCRCSASHRHSVLVAAIVGVLIVPLLLPLLPHRSLALFETGKINEPETSNEPCTPLFDISGSLEYSHSLNVPYALDLSSDTDVPEMAIIEEISIANFVPPMRLDSTAKITKDTQETQKVLLALWLLGTTFLLIRFAFSLRTASRIVAKTMPMEDSMLQSIARQLNITKSVALRQSEVGIVPFTFGIRKPVIVLPESAGSWKEEERRSVLTHELCHVARRDMLWQLLTSLCCAVYWFHPLIWLTAWRLRIEREIACDDLVVLAGEEPRVYASTLLHLAGCLKNVPSRQYALGCTVAMARHHEVKQRIAAILNPKRWRKPLGRVGSLLLLSIAAVGIVAVAMLSPAQAPSIPQPPQSPMPSQPFDVQDDVVPQAFFDAEPLVFATNSETQPASRDEKAERIRDLEIAYATREVQIALLELRMMVPVRRQV